MSQHAAFLAAIRENPDDDTPRLAYADWLQENNQPERAEFIRLQIQQVRLSAFPPRSEEGPHEVGQEADERCAGGQDDDRHSDLHARELRLLAEHADGWAIGPRVMRTARFRRGFIEYVAGTAIDLVEQLPEAAALAPVREVRITNLGAADGLGARLAALPALAHVDSVFVDDMPGDMAPAEQLERLFASPHLKRVRKLTLFCGECNAEVFDRIVSLPALRHLESLNINGGLTADDAIGVLHKHRELPIREFRAHKGPYGSWAMSYNGMCDLAEAGHWKRLEVLNVGIQPDPNILANMANGLQYSKIHTLWLHQGAMGAEDAGMWVYMPGAQNYGIESFAAADSWGPVRDLRFEYIEMNRGQLPALLAAKPLRNLTRLSIFGGMLGPEQAEQLFRCEALAGLRTLDLCGNFALMPGIAGPLADAKHLTNLTDLRLIWTQTADPVAEAVARSPQFARLRNLELANNCVTARGMKALGESPHLARLNRLRLFEHPVGPWQRIVGGPPPEVLRLTPEATAALANGLPNLACLELHGYDFPGETFRPLVEAGDKMWYTADPRQIESMPARVAFVNRVNRIGWFPPLDAYQEEEEPYP